MKNTMLDFAPKRAWVTAFAISAVLFSLTMLVAATSSANGVSFASWLLLAALTAFAGAGVVVLFASFGASSDYERNYRRDHEDDYAWFAPPSPSRAAGTFFD